MITAAFSSNLMYVPSSRRTHLAERTFLFNNEKIEHDAFITQLKDRLVSVNINQVKSDVLPFVKNPKELDIWSNDYFVQLADMVKFE